MAQIIDDTENSQWDRRWNPEPDWESTSETDSGRELKGNFSQSSGSIHVEGGKLYAVCQNGAGSPSEAVFDLDTVLSNENGELVWKEDGSFSQSAEMIEVNSYGLLRANLPNLNGDADRKVINLNEHIGNENGRLVYVE